MSPILGVALYFIIWWVMLFAVLPLGVRTQEDSGEVIQGTAASAPVAPKALRIIGLTTVLATAVFICVWLAMRYKLIPLEAVVQ